MGKDLWNIILDMIITFALFVGKTIAKTYVRLLFHSGTGTENESFVRGMVEKMVTTHPADCVVVIIHVHIMCITGEHLTALFGQILTGEKISFISR
ncbi:hypothetical protein RVX78_004592 [Enterobacter cloacae]|nr:hypothetical protein [Enterobacter cloacae]